MTRPAPIEVGKTYRFDSQTVIVVAIDEFNVRWRGSKRNDGDKITGRPFFEANATLAGAPPRSSRNDAFALKHIANAVARKTMMVNGKFPRGYTTRTYKTPAAVEIGAVITTAPEYRIHPESEKPLRLMAEAEGFVMVRQTWREGRAALPIVMPLAAWEALPPQRKAKKARRSP